MYNGIKLGVIGLLIVLLGAGFFSMNNSARETNERIRANGVEVTAKIVDYSKKVDPNNSGTDPDSRYDYQLIASYAYEGVDYQAKYKTVGKEKTAEEAIGKTVAITINSLSPTEITWGSEESSEIIGFLGYGLSIILIGFGGVIAALGVLSAVPTGWVLKMKSMIRRKNSD